jgi:hypothetical protein
MPAVLPVRAPVCVWRDPIRRTATLGQRREDARRREGVSDEERT